MRSLSENKSSAFSICDPKFKKSVTVQTYTDDLHLLIATLPETLQHTLQALPQDDLLEIIMDLGRIPQARFPEKAVDLAERPVSHEDLDRVVAAVGEFSADNRAGVEGTLHRISALRNRQGNIIGLTLRVGRAVFGTIDQIRDQVERGVNILLLGRPGIGKTTKLREIARVLADEFGKRVIVIDTSNEIAGDGDIPHPAIGNARRMQVPHPDHQHAVMIEAVENHMPEVIVVDEIGTMAEAMAARTIAERGVQLIGTAHGTTLENLILNPILSDLVGGVHAVTLGDEEARLRGTQKTISERKAPPTFDAVVEIASRDEVIVHPDTAKAVDSLLRGISPGGLRRKPEGEVVAVSQASPALETAQHAVPFDQPKSLRIYPYAISYDAVGRVIRDLRLDARLVKRPEQANFILALRSRSDDARLQRIVQTTGAPLHLVKKNTTAQLRRLIQDVFNLWHDREDNEVQAAVWEAEAASRRVLNEGLAVELAPRPAHLRKLQHRIAVRHRLVGISVGSEPLRRLVIHSG
jgi:stage III sporulation protein SpoIIIAA